MAPPRRRRDYQREEKAPFNMEAWTPKTAIGQAVKKGQITTLEQIFESGKPIKEVEIVDALCPDIDNKVLEIASVQRMTKNNRKAKFRVTVVVGDRKGHVGIGVGKEVETRPAIEAAIKDAKKKIISVHFGCGSWECSCGTPHSLPLRLQAKVGTAEIILKPAPRGVGIVAGDTVRSVLQLAGLKDIWSFSRGRTKDIYNMSLATYIALGSLAKIKNVEALKA